MNIANFVKDASNILIENEWMEIPPEAVDRENLASK
ncbi:hypothetical protein ACFVSZ_27540 [Priestia megaterium]